jgi:hypothetical protein
MVCLQGYDSLIAAAADTHWRCAGRRTMASGSRCTRLGVYVGASREISQIGGGFFLRGIRMYHDSNMLENAKAMPRVAAIVLSI